MTNTIRRTLAIGDVHGCRGLLERLLEKLQYDPATDHLVFVGDLIDRGPEPVETVQFVRQLAARGRVTAILGNHEEKCLRWFDRVERERIKGIKNKMTAPKADRLAEWQRLSVEDLAWFRSMPIYTEVAPGWIAVHAGFEDVPMAQQKPDRVIRVRWIDPTTGEHRGLKGEEDPFTKPKDVVHWFERWKGPSNVVFGHAVHSRVSPRTFQTATGIETWGIDTGACYGGNLTALVLETREVVQVRDGKMYAELFGKLADGS